MSYQGSFRITHYCKACNDPPGSTDTALGETPVKNETCALSKSLYKKYKGKTLTLGDYDYKIIDFHGQGDDIVDIYNGDCSECECDDCSDNDDIVDGEIN